jgi:predicted RNA-binding Zn-ribbon protein involved in translation (DUF1610 family)
MTEDPRFGVHCPTCGAVELGLDRLWLVLATAPDRSHYAFACPGCGRTARRPADAGTVAVLAGLVAVEELDVPAEALEVHEGSALTTDDLIDLMLTVAAHEEARPTP